ncbi:hypothetical protein [Sphingomonas sp.]|uniref:hypothetical protein n=1 Tax=Sphingomonas sp. TaxID=28214 RepID=UPI003BAB4CE5
MEQNNGRLLESLAECAAKMLAASDPRRMIDYLFERVRKELRIDVYFHYLVDGEAALRLEGSGGLTPAQIQLGQRLEVRAGRVRHGGAGPGSLSGRKCADQHRSDDRLHPGRWS